MILQSITPTVEGNDMELCADLLSSGSIVGCDLYVVLNTSNGKAGEIT